MNFYLLIAKLCSALLCVQFCNAEDNLSIRSDFLPHKTKNGYFIKWKVINLADDIKLVCMDNVSFTLQCKREGRNDLVSIQASTAGSKYNVSNPRYLKIGSVNVGGRITTLNSYCEIPLKCDKDIGDIAEIKAGDVLKISCSTNILVLGENKFRNYSIDDSYKVEVSPKGDFLFVPLKR